MLSRPDGWDGHFYIVRQFIDELAGFEFWLCPALLAFFPEAPQEVFVKVMAHPLRSLIPNGISHHVCVRFGC